MCRAARVSCVFFFQAEDGIRDLVRSRGLGDVYKRQDQDRILEIRGVGHRPLPERKPRDPRLGLQFTQQLSLIHI